LLPYATGERGWKHRQITDLPAGRLAPLLRRAANAYGEPRCERGIRRLPGAGADAGATDLPGPDGRPLAAYNFGTTLSGPLMTWLRCRSLLDEGIRPRLLLVEVLPAFLNEPGPGRTCEENWIQVPTLATADMAQLGPYCADPGRLWGIWLHSRLLPAYAHRDRILERLAPSWLHKARHGDPHKLFDRWGWYAAGGRRLATPENRRLPALALALAVGPHAVADVQAEGDELRGTWVVVAVEVDGKRLPDKELKKAPAVLTLGGGTYTLRLGYQTTTGSYTLAAARSPRRVNSTPGDGPSKGKTLKGIYKVDGDTLTACYDTSGKHHPTAFATAGKPGWVLIVYKRERKPE
jgi:uncharacterized protein (TIGR03067 family)